VNSQELLALADRVDAVEKSDNGLDVLIEVALFEPDADTLSVRANSAGTKVTYTVAEGRPETCWAPDWTVGFSERANASARLRALATSRSQHEGAE
jgi:hypothetical protein